MIGTVVLAHQGGWDEALFVLAPLALFAALLMVARRRVDRMDADNEADGSSDDRTANDRTPDTR